MLYLHYCRKLLLNGKRSKYIAFHRKLSGVIETTGKKSGIFPKNRKTTLLIKTTVVTSALKFHILVPQFSKGYFSWVGLKKTVFAEVFLYWLKG